MVKLVKEREGITLMELLVAISLLAIVLLAAGGLYFVGQRALIAGNRRARVQDEARLAMEHMVRDIRLGNLIDDDADTGTPLGPFPLETNEIHVRMDWNPTNLTPINNPANFTDDWEVYYRYNSSQIQVNYRTPPWTEPTPGPWSGWEAIGERIVDPGVLGRSIFTVEDEPMSPIFLTLDLTARYDPASGANPPRNPEMRLQAGASLRSMASD